MVARAITHRAEAAAAAALRVCNFHSCPPTLRREAACLLLRRDGNENDFTLVAPVQPVAAALSAHTSRTTAMDAGVSGWVHHLVVDASVKYGNCYASRPFYRLVCAACLLFSVLFFVLSAQQPSTVGRTHHEAIRRTLSLLEPLGPRVDAADLTVRPFAFDISLQPSAAKSTFRSAMKIFSCVRSLCIV
jgi:hypothetical protein